MFGGLFGRSHEGSIVERLVAETRAGLQGIGMNPRQAQSIARDLVTGIRDGMLKVNPNRLVIFEQGLGSRLLETIDQNPALAKKLELLHSHGVRDEDFRRWHDLCGLEQKVLLKTDEWMMVSMYTAAKSEGHSEKAAAKLVAQAHARYTETPEKIGSEGSAALLPVELKLRVNDYRNKRLQTDPATFNEEIAAAGDFNAFVRKAMQAGLL